MAHLHIYPVRDVWDMSASFVIAEVARGAKVYRAEEVRSRSVQICRVRRGARAHGGVQVPRAEQEK